jgi:hypothetical protein
VYYSGNAGDPSINLGGGYLIDDGFHSACSTAGTLFDIPHGSFSDYEKEPTEQNEKAKNKLSLEWRSK